MIAESNRHNVLTGIVKGHYNAMLRDRELLKLSVASAQRADAAGCEEGGGEKNKRLRPKAKGGTRSQQPRKRAAPAKGSRSLDTTSSSVSTATTTVDTRKPQHAPQNRRVWRGPAASTPLKPPPHPRVVNQDAPSSFVSEGGSRSQGAGVGVGTGRPGQQFALPPLEQRYGVGVVDSWASSPVALKFRRPRQRSVDIASLEFEAYARFVETLMPPGSLQGQKRTAAAEEGQAEKKEEGKEKGRGLGVDEQAILLPCPRENTQGRSLLRVHPGVLPIRKEGEREGEVGDSAVSPGYCASGCTEPTLGLGVGATFFHGDSRSCEDIGTSSKKEGGIFDGERSDISRQGDTSTLSKRSPSEDRDGSQQGNGTAPNPTSQPADKEGLTSPASNGTTGTGQKNTASSPLRRTFSTSSVGPRRHHPNQAPLASSRSQHNLGSMREPPKPPLPGGGTNGGGGKGVGNSARTPPYDGWARDLPAADTLDATAYTFRSCGARKVFKQTQRLLEALRTPARGSLVGGGGGLRQGGGGGGGGKIGGDSAVIVRRPIAAVTTGPTVAGVIKTEASGSERFSLLPNNPRMWRGVNKFGDRLARLAEVFRCVGPPHTVRIDSEILLFDALARRGEEGGQGGGGGGGVRGATTTTTVVNRGRPWDDLVHAWEVRLSVCEVRIVSNRRLFVPWCSWLRLSRL